ncbi:MULTISPECIES: hypothetical protein [Streptomyces]|uniref:Uncharacterized protein n=2 Tax=Streptomyces rimosus subsp. rimosus TaxID=132474 RepID=L8EX66_STRR1|nr:MULTISPECIES: hypothetical protein [Streptomyces]KOG76466.1 hypothetical protein ADK78_10335 [Kitasatospora aureofaciens]MYT48270.1 hypothetical protein [Streptomyces sp. SID5471]KEF03561.1 hypothetical protein DF17_28405 [Streptomyces rimosus]KOT41199.1 hypothetical protein ADK84_12670 [Streptomyces sp. NRRL WC-3701]KOT46170.1 hypothetical protein ADK42_01575 [Streptomyces rimosus subsp. rimosus]
MLITCTSPATTGPSPGLLATLGAWTWLGLDPAEAPLGHLLLAHPPGRTACDTPAAIEVRMRRIADALGGLATPQERVPNLGARLLMVSRTTVLLRFDGTRFGVRLPVRPGWTQQVQRHGQAVITVGLPPLKRSADLADVDIYLDDTLASGRLLFGLTYPI